MIFKAKSHFNKQPSREWLPVEQIKLAPQSPMGTAPYAHSFARVARRNKENVVERINQPGWGGGQLSLECDQVLGGCRNPPSPLSRIHAKHQPSLQFDLLCEQQLLPMGSDIPPRGQSIECESAVLPQVLQRAKTLLSRYAQEMYRLLQENSQLREQLRRRQ